MNRALKILSVAVILFLAYMWVSILYKSCNKPSEFDNFQDDMAVSDEEVPSLSDEYENDPFFASDGGEVEGEKGDDTKEDPIDYDALDSRIEESQSGSSSTASTKATKTKKTTRPTTLYESTEGGKYLVIAGSYLLETNANIMVKKLDRLGYDKAEKVNFDLSEFHSVCAGRFDDYTKAVQMSAELKRRGVENYVHTKK